MRSQLLVSMAALAAASVLSPVASADPGVTAFPGMEIRQGTNLCTLGYVDVQQRVAYTAGHCHADGPVTDRSGRPIGVTTSSQTTISQGAIIATDQVITDYQQIALNPGVDANDVLPDGSLSGELCPVPSLEEQAWAALVKRQEPRQTIKFKLESLGVEVKDIDVPSPVKTAQEPGA